MQEEGGKDASVVYVRIQECIKFEKDLVLRASSQVPLNPQPQDIVMDNLSFVRKRVEGTGDLIKQMVAQQDAFEINLTEKQTYEGNLISNFLYLYLIVCLSCTSFINISFRISYML